MFSPILFLWKKLCIISINPLNVGLNSPMKPSMPGDFFWGSLKITN